MQEIADKPAKRRGRPPMERPERKIANITFRSRGGMREMLEASAAASGLSVSEEVEKRVGRTFDLNYLLGDNPTALVFRSIASAVRRFEQASGKSWIEDSETQERVHEAVTKMVDVLLGMRQQIDDRRSTGVGLPVDWNDLHQRLRARLFALEIGVDELQKYIKEKELEYLPVMREARGKSIYKVEVARVRAILQRADKGELADIAASLVLIDHEARVVQTQAGVVVSEQGSDGAWRQVLPEWHGAEPPPWAEDTAEELRARIEMMLNLPPDLMPPGLSQATPDELADMKPARGSLPPEIGDRALFDGATADLPADQGEKAGRRRIDLNGVDRSDVTFPSSDPPRRLDLGPETPPPAPRRGRKAKV